MFSHLSVILFTGGYTDTALGRHPQADTPWADTSPGQTPALGRHPLNRHPLGRHSLPPWADIPTSLSSGRQPPWADTPRQTPALGRHPLGRHPPSAGKPPPGQTHPPRDGHCSERYASYWNAFLYNDTFGIFTKNLGPWVNPKKVTLDMAV